MKCPTVSTLVLLSFPPPPGPPCLFTRRGAGQICQGVCCGQKCPPNPQIEALTPQYYGRKKPEEGPHWEPNQPYLNVGLPASRTGGREQCC